MRDEDALDHAIREAAREYNPPPETPREAIWEGVRRKRRLRPAGGGSPWRRWAWIPVAAAAMLAIGFGLGRLRAPVAEGPAAVPQTAERVEPVQDPAEDGDGRNPGAFRMAAADFLSRTETLLTRYRSAPPGAPSNELGRWARDLLSETRLLLDSPVAEDRELKELLWDLELLLAQISYVAGGQERTGKEQLVNERLERRDILNRLRAWVPSGPFGT